MSEPARIQETELSVETESVADSAPAGAASSLHALATDGIPAPTADALPHEAAVDLVLVQRTQQGDLPAYDELIRRYQERIYATIYHMTGNHEDANDLAQETFLKGFTALKTFKGDSSFYTWVYRIAVNKTINFRKLRKNKAHLSLNDMDFSAENDPDMVQLVSDKTPRREAGLSELHDKLGEAMQKLSPVHRLVVTLHDVQGLPHEEIATIMDCNIGTVRSRLFYARQQLQAYLSDYLK